MHVQIVPLAILTIYAVLTIGAANILLKRRLGSEHFLGSAPGMASTAHIASLSKNPLLEWDINPNPLRTSLFSEPFRIEDGMFLMSGEPGMGWNLRTDIPESWIAYTGNVTG